MKNLKILSSILVIGLTMFSFSLNAQSLGGDGSEPCEGQHYFLCDSWYPEVNGVRQGLAGAVAEACPNGGSFQFTWLDC